MTENELSNLIKEALLTLAGQCDGARAKDTVGFNAMDTAYGHYLARQAASVGLSQVERDRAHRMLVKYHRQLAEVGITLPAAPEKSDGTVVRSNGLIVVTFAKIPSESVRAMIKEIPGKRWCPEMPGKPWVVPYNDLSVEKLRDALKGLSMDWQFDVNEEAPKVEPVNVEPVDTAAVVITKHNGSLAVRFPNPDGRQERVSRLKGLAERRWAPDEEGKPWLVPNRLAKQVVEMFPEAQIDQAVLDMLTQQGAAAQLSNAADGTFVIPGLKGEPYPFQQVGVQFVEVSNGRALIADEMGLGKTIQALAWLQLHPEQRPAIIVCPASLKLNWLVEARKWLSTNEKIVIAEGRKPYNTGNAITIINWDILKYWQEYLIKQKPAVIIADEAHYAKNLDASRTKALRALTKAISHVIMLTGTPVINRPAEIWPLLNMIDPQSWPSFMKFAQKYCGAYHNGFGWDFSGASNLEELHEMIKPYVIRRTKTQVLKELPEKRRVNVVVEFTPGTRGEYEQAIENARQKLGGSSAENLALIEAAKQAAVKGKLDACIDWIENFIGNDEKLVVFIWHNETARRLMEHFGDRAVMITGETPVDKRQGIVERFQKDEKVRLFVGNIVAAGVGITLTAASNVAFIEFAWTPGQMTQAEDRCHRIGQTESVTVWHLIATETIEDKIVELIESKRVVVDVVTDGKEGEQRFGILNELIKIIKA